MKIRKLTEADKLEILLLDIKIEQNNREIKFLKHFMFVFKIFSLFFLIIGIALFVNIMVSL